MEARSDPERGFSGRTILALAGGETRMIKDMIRRLLPQAIAKSVRNYRTLSIRFGQYRSIRRWECVDATGKPIPWYTYPAIEYVGQLDLSDKTIFEYGSGNSTMFWSKRCRRVIAVEDNQEWYEKIKRRLPDNVEYHLIKDEMEYTEAVHRYRGELDVIIIDGSYRFQCAAAARGRLKEDGFMILDNSDWLEKTAAFLRDSDLIEVDMAGFGPINDYTWTTSFFFTRNVRLKSSQGRQPVHGTGSLHMSEAQYCALHRA